MKRDQKMNIDLQFVIKLIAIHKATFKNVFDDCEFETFKVMFANYDLSKTANWE